MGSPNKEKIIKPSPILLDRLQSANESLSPSQVHTPCLGVLTPSELAFDTEVYPT